MDPLGRAPAAVPAAVFILGIALAGWNALTIAVACVAGIAASCVTPKRPVLLLPVLLLAGIILGGRSLEEDRARTLAWLGNPEGFADLHMVGRIVASPEPTVEGDRILFLDGYPEAIPELRDRPFRSRLRIRAAPPDAMAEVDRLRRGDRVRLWCRIGVPRKYANPGSTDPVAALRGRRLLALGTVKSPRLIERLEEGEPSPGRTLDCCRASLRRSLDLVCRDRPGVRGLLGAMLLGDRERLPEANYRTLRNAGMVHLTAISGLHVSMVAVVLLGALRRCGITRHAIPAVAGAFLASLSHLVGSRPPVLRAVFTASTGMTGRWLGRSGHPLNTLSLAAWFLSALHPAIVSDPGFQLSFLATAGILLFTGPISRALPLPAAIGIPMAVSLAAYLSTAPVAALHFGRLAPVAVLSNLAAAPLCGLILAGGTAAMLLEGIPILGSCSAALAIRSCDLLMRVAGYAASLPCGSLRTAAPDAWFVILYFLLLLQAPRKRIILQGAFALVLVLLHLGPVPGRPAGEMELTVPDVGQGQAVVLRDAAGRFYLLDAGGSPGGRFDVGERVLAPWLAASGCRRIEVLAISHPHQDHAGGAMAILDEFEVGELWLAPGTMHSPVMYALSVRARERGAALRWVRAGIEFHRPGFRMEILHPAREEILPSVNDRSITVRAVTACGSILIPGDLERRGEEAVLNQDVRIEADLLVAGHHGARESSSCAFLNAIRPEIALISAGSGNRFGHPHAETLARMRRRGISVYRTDRNGMVKLTCKGSEWEVGLLSDEERHRNERQAEQDQ